MEEGKVQAMLDWPPHETIKDLQRFANYYQRFIRNFSMVVAPLTFFIKGAPC